MILQCTGNDFRRTGRTAIDENDNRLAVSQVALACIEARHILRIATTGRDDFTLVEEGVGNSHSLIEQTARIEAKIQHEALELFGRNLVLNILDRLLEVFGCLFGERDDAQIADIVLDAIANGLHLDDSACDLQRDRLVDALALDRQLDRRTDFTAHLVDRIGQRKTANFLPVNLGDEIACQHTGLGSGRIVNRRDDLHEIVVHRHFDAKTAKLTLGLHAHVLRGFRVEIGGMGIERGQHAVDRAFGQLLVVRRRHILRAHPFENITKKGQFLVDIAIFPCRKSSGSRRALDHHHG